MTVSNVFETCIFDYVPFHDLLAFASAARSCGFVVFHYVQNFLKKHWKNIVFTISTVETAVCFPVTTPRFFLHWISHELKFIHGVFLVWHPATFTYAEQRWKEFNYFKQRFATYWISFAEIVSDCSYLNFEKKLPDKRIMTRFNSTLLTVLQMNPKKEWPDVLEQVFALMGCVATSKELQYLLFQIERDSLHPSSCYEPPLPRIYKWISTFFRSSATAHAMDTSPMFQGMHVPCRGWKCTTIMSRNLLDSEKSIPSLEWRLHRWLNKEKQRFWAFIKHDRVMVIVAEIKRDNIPIVYNVYYRRYSFSRYFHNVVVEWVRHVQHLHDTLYCPALQISNLKISMPISWSRRRKRKEIETGSDAYIPSSPTPQMMQREPSARKRFRPAR